MGCASLGLVAGAFAFACDGDEETPEDRFFGVFGELFFLEARISVRVGIWFLSFRSGVVKTPETTAFVQSTMSLSIWTLVAVILGLTLALGGVVGGSPSSGIIDVVLTFLKVPASLGVASRRLFFELGLIGVDGREGEDVKGCSDEDGI